MAWTERMADGYRGRYRDADRKKQTILDPDGQPWKRKRDAQAAAREEEVKASRRAAKPTAARHAGSMTWSQAWERYLETRDLVSNSIANDTQLMESRIKPRWGDVPLNQIKRTGPGGVQTWVDTAFKGLSPATVRKVFGVFRLPINWALNEEILDASPCIKVRLPDIPENPKPYLDPGTSLKLDLLPHHRLFVDFGLETGMRPSEVSGLHVGKIDGTKVVVDTVYVDKQHFIRPWTKTKKARTLPLTPRALRAVEEALAGRELTSGCGVPHYGDVECRGALVFVRPNGGVIRPQALRLAIQKAVEAAQTKTSSAYAIRRGFATRAAKHLDAFALARWMGHSDLTQTYGYVQETEEAVLPLLEAFAAEDPIGGSNGGAPAPADTRPDSTSPS